MKKPTDAELRSARTDFRALLSRPTPERTWQAFFAANPFVLSRSLPLRLEPCDILPLGRAGRSEPDFLIYPASSPSIPTHGLIELKTNSTRVLTVPRRNVVSLTRDAATAVNQLRVYDRDYDLFSPVKRCLSLSSASHLFVIMGLREEVVKLGERPDLHRQLADLIPGDVRFLGFDELLHAYECGLAQSVFILLPDLSAYETQEDAKVASLVPLTNISRTMYMFTDFPIKRMMAPSLPIDPFMKAIKSDFALTLPLPDQIPSRFGGHDFDVLYAMDSADSCVDELAEHFASIPKDERRDCVVVVDIHELQVNSDLHDLRALDCDAQVRHFTSDDFTAPRLLARTLRERGSNGLIFPTARREGFGIAMFAVDKLTYRGVAARYVLEDVEGRVNVRLVGA